MEIAFNQSICKYSEIKNSSNFLTYTWLSVSQKRQTGLTDRVKISSPRFKFYKSIDKKRKIAKFFFVIIFEYMQKKAKGNIYISAAKNPSKKKVQRKYKKNEENWEKRETVS